MLAKRLFHFVGRAILVSIAAGFCFGLTQQSEAARDLVNPAGFDAYTVAPLAGQNSWQLDEVNGSTAAVQSTVFQSGGKAVRVERAAAANGDQRWYVDVPNAPVQRFVIVDWDMLVEETISNNYGPFLGVEAYDYAGNELYVDKGVLGAFGVDASSNDLLYQASDGFLTPIGGGNTASYNQWHHFRMVVDFTDNKYHAFFNGNLVKTSNFVDGPGLNDFTDADISALAAQAGSIPQTLPGVAYFDNFLVREGLTGDYNDDGKVDMADFTSWKQTFGSSVSVGGTMADGNGDLVVNAADFTVWRDNLGATLNLPAGSGSLSVAIPEPSTLALAFLVLVPFLLLRRGGGCKLIGQGGALGR